MKVLATYFIMALLVSVLFGVRFIGEVSAVDYTEYTGTLNGADYVLRIPDPWNGMLVVCCRGYSHEPVADARTVGPFSARAPTMLSQGFAVAASNYGAGGYCVQEGVNATRQLTEYIIDNYGVTGKAFLIGASMGGCIALLLGEQHPELFSGVLDMFGTKDMKSQYETKVRWASLNDSELTAELTALTAPSPPSIFPNLEGLRTYCNLSATDIESEMGGTPQEKPEAYEAVSPVYNAKISIPVITIHGTSDVLVPYSQSVMYQEAVANAGRSSLYRLYPIEGGEHGGPTIGAKVSGYFDELVEWSNSLSPAIPTSPSSPKPEPITVEPIVAVSIAAVCVAIAGLVIYSVKRKRQ